MKLYYFPGACSLATHIVLCALDMPYELERVNLANKVTESGEDFFSITPKGFVPALQLNDGRVLTEGSVILQYLADQAPDKNLVPLAGSMVRYRVMEWLSYISSDLQKGFAPLFNPETNDATRITVHTNLGGHFDIVAAQLEETPFIVGERFTIADALLFTVLNWAQYVELSLERWPVLQAYLEKVAVIPSVRQAMAEEGLIAE